MCVCRYKTMALLLVMIADESEETDCPWLSKNLKNRITVYSVIQNLHLPINSLDVRANLVVCGCDNEAIYLINDLATY